jgi:hypothetical protein
MQLFYQDFAFDGRQMPVEEIDPTASEYVGAGVKQAFELNPSTQALRLGQLGALGSSGPKSYIDPTTGQEVDLGASMAPDDPRAQAMTLDQANEEGKELGLRFSQPPTRGQFDYMAEMKRSEQQRSEILAKSPGIAATGIGFLADLGASAIDPINIASAFVPIVREARYGKMVAQLGKTGARLTKGALEGAGGTLLIEPMVYAQAQALQQEFGLYDAFVDVVAGGAFGAGLHYAGGKVSDMTRMRRAGAAFLREAEEMVIRPLPDYSVYRVVDWRTIKTPAGETPHMVESMNPEDRAKVLGAAVKAVESDNWPKVDELFKTLPEAKSIALHDKKYPATTRLRSNFTAADFVRESTVTELINSHLFRTVKGADNPDVKVANESLLKHLTKGSKKLDGWTLWTRTDEAYRADAHPELLEHPEQKVYVDVEAKTIVASDGASLAAVRHEIERALDIVQGYKGDEAGAYRYKRDDLDGPVMHRKILSELYKTDPSRAPDPEAKPEQAVDLFSRPEPVMKPAERASQEIWDQVEQDKDKDLDTLIKEEEIEVLEDTIRSVQNSARAKGVLEKVTPIEERDLFDLAAVSTTAQQMAKKVEVAVQEAVDTGGKNAELMNTVRSAFDADPELIRRWIADEITDEEFDALAGKPLPEKTPEEGAEPKGDAGEDDMMAEMERAVLAKLGENKANAALEQAKSILGDMDPKEAEAALAEFGAKLMDILDAVEPADIADMETAVIVKEQQLLSGPKQVRDLFNQSEKAEFDEAHGKRTLRASAAATEALRRAKSEQSAAGGASENGVQAPRLGGDGPVIGGARFVLDTERSAAGGERGIAETARSLGYGTIPSRVVTPDGTIEVGVEPVIVEWDSLRKAEGAFQPRDRTRKESDANIRERANRLDPEQLMPTRVSDSGPPIITKDGMVISGNGRYATLGEVYRHLTLEAQARRYRERLGPAADGYRQPVLVMRLTDDLSEEALVKFADRSNRGRIEQMSAAEKAQRDVQAAGMDLMQLYEGGDFERRENRDFLQGFLRKAVTTSELGEISKNGRLTKEGYDRINAAVLAAAYDDTGVLSLMLESADDNIRSITSAYRDVAPAFMKLRAEIAAGVVKEDMDLTPYMMEAARIISEQRNKGVKIANFLAQQDAFNRLDPTVETLIRAYYDPKLSRAVSAMRIGEYLTDFVSEARQHKTGGFLPDETTISDVVGIAQRKREQGITSDAEDTTGLPGLEQSAGAGAPEVRPAAPEPAPAAARQDAGKRSSNPGIAKLQELAGNKVEFDKQANKLRDKLKKVDLELLAEQHLGRPLTAPERKTKNATMDAIKATIEQVASEPAAKPAKAVDVPAKEPASKPAQFWEEPEQPVEPAPPVRDKDGMTPEYRAQLARAAWSGIRETLDMVDYHEKARQIGKPWAHALAVRVDTLKKEIDAGHTNNAQVALEGALGMATKLKDAFPNDPKISIMTQDIRAAARQRGIEVVRDGEIVERETEAPRTGDAQQEPGASLPSLSRFYDYLQGPSVVKSSRWMAKQLKISVEEASKLLDHGVENGWLKLKDDGTYIRVAKKDRPALPADYSIVEFPGSGPKKSLTDRILGRDPLSINTEKSIAAFKERIAAKIEKLSEERDALDKELSQVFKDTIVADEKIQKSKDLGVTGIHDKKNVEALQALRDRRFALQAEIEAKHEQIVKLADLRDGSAKGGIIRAEDLSLKGWSNTDIEAALGPLTASDIIRITELDALHFLRELHGYTSIGQIRRDYGFIDEADYVHVAKISGFKPSALYDNLILERELQAQLISAKVMTEAARILPPAIQTSISEGATINGRRVHGLFQPIDKAPGFIMLAKSWDEGKAIETIHHETIHALRWNRLFTKREWQILTDAAMKEGWMSPERQKQYRDAYRDDAQRIADRLGRPINITEAQFMEKMMEEAVAHGYGFWAKERHGKIETPPDLLFDRIRKFLHELFKAAKNYFKAPTAEDVFKAVHSGKIAQRWSEWNGGRVDDNARNSMRSFSLAEQTDELNANMKELAFDDSEKKGTAAIRSIEALVPCAVYHA